MLRLTSRPFAVRDPGSSRLSLPAMASGQSRVKPAAALVLVLVLALLAGPMAGVASGHAALVHANPAPGATLRNSPRTIRLTFSEAVEPSVSDVNVVDSADRSLSGGAPVTTNASQRSIEVPVEALGRGTYTVDWRVVSSDDGHGTSGSYVFGVSVAPPGSAAVAGTSTPASSPLEVAARWVLLVGLVALLGAAVAGVARYGGRGNSGLALAAGGWLASVVGLALLAEAQRRTASSSFATFIDTPTGHAVIRRATAIAIAGVALAIAWRAPRARRGAFLVVALAAVAAIAFHVGAGHAATGPWPSTVTITAQTVHFAAAGIWFGGLAALLLGIRGEPSAAAGDAVRRFAIVAAIALVVVVATGTLRAIDELSSFGQLFTTGYGRAILAKIALVAVIAGIAARNRRSVAAAATELRPLRRRARLELGLAGLALAVAALMGTLAPPAPAGPPAARGLTAAGTDSNASVHAELTTAASRLGPNRFVLQMTDSESGEPVRAKSVRLRFVPVDDPDVKPSTLQLRPGPADTYVRSASNLKFDGRWEVDVLARRGAEPIRVALHLDVPGPKHFVSVEHIPGKPPKYTMQIGSVGYIRIVPQPERPGPSTVLVTCYTAFGGISKVDGLVVTLASSDGGAVPQPVRRLGAGRFDADVDFASGPAALAVVAHTADGTRLRGGFHLDIPG
jgi:copper transport protein